MDGCLGARLELGRRRRLRVDRAGRIRAVIDGHRRTLDRGDRTGLCCAACRATDERMLQHGGRAHASVGFGQQ
eukprot:536640-Prymnesium_polylepis.1